MTADGEDLVTVRCGQASWDAGRSRNDDSPDRHDFVLHASIVQDALKRSSPMIHADDTRRAVPNQIDHTRNLVDAAFRDVPGAAAQA